MATYTVSAVTDHTLPTHFWGLNSPTFFLSADGPNATFQQLFKDMKPEVWRMEWNHSNTFTAGSADLTGFQTFILAVQASNGIKTLVQLPMAPAQYPNCSIGPGVASNVAGGSDARAPAMVAARVKALVDAGVDVAGVEIGNEPSLASRSANSDGTAWYGNKTSPGIATYPPGFPADQGEQNAECNDAWAIAHHRDYVNACRAVLSASMPYYGYALATGFADASMFSQRFIDGNVYQNHGGIDPSSVGSNLPYTDVLSYHPYIGNPVTHASNYPASLTDPQGSLNSIFYATNTEGKSSLSASAPLLYAQLVAAGHPEKQISITETAYFRSDELGGLGDVGVAIACANNQAAWNLRDIYWYAYDRGGSADFILNGPSPYALLYRGLTFRDAIGPFLSKYKRITTASVASAPGSTPSSSWSNSVTRIQASFGYDTNGNLGCLIANIDLTNTEQVTINLVGVPKGPVVGKYLQPGGSAPIDIGQLTVSGTTITTNAGGFPSMTPGAALFLEIPLETSVVTPPPPPPPPSTNSKISALSDDFNGNAQSNLWKTVTSGASTTIADTNQHLELTTSGGPTIDWVQLAVDDNNQLGIRQSGANLEAYKIVAGVTTSLATVASSAGIYFQIREASGTIYWEYGSDPSAAMTTLFSVANPLTVTGLQARIGSGSGLGYAEWQSVAFYDLTSDRIFLQYVQAGTSSTPTVFDNCNTAAVVTTDLGAWTTAVQINATSPVSPPIVPDFGPWTDAVQINALLLRPEHIGTTPIFSEEG